MMGLVAFFILAWLLYELAKYTASLIRYDEQWLARSFFQKLNAVGFAFMADNLVCAGLNFFIPSTVVFFVWIIAPIYHFWTRREYKKAVALEKAIKEFETRQEIAALEERRSNLVKLNQWFDSAPDWYYPQERDKFFRWLEAENELANFHNHWDEYLRLYMFGLNTGRTCICHLDHLTYAEKQAKGDLAWKRIVMAREGNIPTAPKKNRIDKKSSSEKQLKRNAEKAAVAKEKADEDDKRHVEELRAQVMRARAAYKLGR